MSPMVGPVIGPDIVPYIVNDKGCSKSKYSHSYCT